MDCRFGRNARGLRSLRRVWELDDAWILQSVVFAGRRGDLARVIGQADAINAAIPSADVLQRAAGRLSAAGLLEVAGPRLRATRTGRRVVRRASGWRSHAREVPPRLLEVLDREVPFPDTPTDWDLSAVEWRVAYDRYYPPERRPS